MSQDFLDAIRYGTKTALVSSVLFIGLLGIFIKTGTIDLQFGGVIILIFFIFIPGLFISWFSTFLFFKARRKYHVTFGNGILLLVLINVFVLLLEILTNSSDMYLIHLMISTVLFVNWSVACRSKHSF